MFICTHILSSHLKDTYQLTLLLNVFLGCSILLGDLLDFTLVCSEETVRSFSLSFAFSCWPHNNSLSILINHELITLVQKCCTMYIKNMTAQLGVHHVELHKFDNFTVAGHVLSWQTVREIWLKFAKIIKLMNIHSVWQNFLKSANLIATYISGQTVGGQWGWGT